jgi:hypothetical protein
MYTYRKAFGCKSAPPIVIVWIRGGELATSGFEVSRRKDTLTDELRGKLERIFDFLVRNRQFNKAVQHAAYRQDILPWPDTGSKLQSLLHSKAHTQSSPKLDVLMPTWKQLQQNYDAFKKARSPSDLNEALWTLAKPNIVRDRANRPVFEEMWTALEKALASVRRRQPFSSSRSSRYTPCQSITTCGSCLISRSIHRTDSRSLWTQ